MLWVPGVSAEAVNCAEPLVIVLVPKVVVPSRNVTVPVGVPVYAACTVALSVADWPKLTEDALSETDVVLVAWLTFCVNAADVLGLRSVSPL